MGQPGVRGGVCIKHGANKAKTCSHERCTNNAQSGGVCIRHGAKVRCCSRKTCSHEGCHKQARKGGVCVGHGATNLACGRREAKASGNARAVDGEGGAVAARADVEENGAVLQPGIVPSAGELSFICADGEGDAVAVVSATGEAMAGRDSKGGTIVTAERSIITRA